MSSRSISVSRLAYNLLNRAKLAGWTKIIRTERF